MSSPELRKRAAASSTPASSTSPDPTKRKTTKTESSWSILEAGRILFALLLLTGAVSWIITGESFVFGWRKLPTLLGEARRYMKGPMTLTDAELSLYNGTDPTLPIYLALNSSIYDVSASPQTYGPQGSYAFFAGRDATRAFLTGCFKEDLSPDLRGVEEMFIPVDEDVETQKLSKGELKIRRERDLRLARKQMAESIGQWRGVFEGKSGRPYFWVGTVKREEGWEEKLPMPTLCEAAATGRPKRADVEKTEKSTQYGGRPAGM